MRRKTPMRNGTWLEVALNGPWGRAKQPGIPVRVEEIVAEGAACAGEGAAIVHVHAYDEALGRQRDDPDIYARIIEGIRARADCIVYPTIPFASDGMDAGARFAAIETLAKRGLLEWAVVDPGSVNFDRFVYLNPNEHIRHGLALAARHRFHPSYAIYEPGFVRHGARLAAGVPGLPAPLYRFMFSEGFAFGFPPARWALEAYLRLLAECAPDAPWMIAGLAVDALPLVPEAVARGGHVRVGLEDAPFGTPRSNLDWVRAARAAIERAGGRLASAAEVRNALAAG
jgi:3-keto-5-aminohexanoate cleavage enzyme